MPTKKTGKKDALKKSKTTTPGGKAKTPAESIGDPKTTVPGGKAKKG